jgi:hypothetical protein
MALTNLEKLRILFRSREIKEMTIEDLEIWEGFEEIYPSYIRFPESIEFNQKHYCRRTETIKYLKKIIKNIDKMIKEIIHSPELLKQIRLVPAKRSKEIEKYIIKEKKRLDLHLKRLRKLRLTKLKEVRNSSHA